MSLLETFDLGGEQPMLSYYMIYFEKFRKVLQRTDKELLNITIETRTLLHYIHKETITEIFFKFMFKSICL